MAWTDADVGSPTTAGSASSSVGVWTQNGAGSDIYSTTDQFNYNYQQVSGDATVVLRVTAFPNTNFDKFGIMVRKDLTGGSANSMLLIQSSNTNLFDGYRSSAGGSTTHDNVITGPSFNIWMRLKYAQATQTVTEDYSSDGVTWTNLCSYTNSGLPASGTYYIGVAVCSTTTGATVAATYDNLSLTQATTALITAARSKFFTAKALKGQARSRFLLRTGLKAQARSRFLTRTGLAAQTRSTFLIAKVLKTAARARFAVAAALKAQTRAQFVIAKHIAEQARARFLIRTGLTAQTRAKFLTRTGLITQTRAKFFLRTALTTATRSIFKVLASGTKALTTAARVRFIERAVLSVPGRARFSLRRSQQTQTRARYAIRFALSEQSRSKYFIRFSLKTPTRSRYIIRLVLVAKARSRFVLRSALTTVAHSKFFIFFTGLSLPLLTARGNPVSLLTATPSGAVALLTVTGGQTMVTPFSTIQSPITVKDTSGNPVTNLSAVTLTVTYPDGTTSTLLTLGSGIQNSGSGVYTASYVTKDMGRIQEDWAVTAADGITVARARFTVPVTYQGV